MESREYKAPEIAGPDEIMPAPEVKLDDEAYIKFIPGSLVYGPNGEFLKVEALDFMGGGVVFQDIEKPGNYQFVEISDLGDYERQLQDNDYKDQIFISKTGGWAVKVIDVVPEKNNIIIMGADNIGYQVPFEEFAKEFTEESEDKAVYFPGSFITDKKTNELVYIQELDEAAGKAKILRCRLVDKSRPFSYSSWSTTGGQEEEVTINDLEEGYRQVLAPAEELVKMGWGKQKYVGESGVMREVVESDEDEEAEEGKKEAA
jgi:hypothetical protein